jgi:hypothetical protein
MTDELAEKLAEKLHYLTWSEDMNGYFMTEEELKQEILDIANDLEEPKEFWYICDFRVVRGIEGESSFTREEIAKMKSIGNYFETKEEAEKAAEKLKAWTKLKGNGFEFTGWAMASSDTVVIYANRKFESIQAEKYLDLLFGKLK